MERTDFNTIFWHDGVIDSINIDIKDGDTKYGCIELLSRVYKDEQSKNRFGLAIRFCDVISLSANCDFFELSDNRIAGNISNAYEKKEFMNTKRRNTECSSADNRFSIYRFYLTDGYIKIVAGSVRIEQR